MGYPLGLTLANVFLYHYERNGWIIDHLILNLLYAEGMLMIFWFFFHLREFV